MAGTKLRGLTDFVNKFERLGLTLRLQTPRETRLKP